MYNTKLLAQINVVEKADDSDDLFIEGYANTVNKDRAGDVILRTAWETKSAMTNFLKNPVILAFHDHSNPVGTMVSYEVTELGLKIKAKISKGAGRVYDLIKDGVLRTFSVGFGILDAEYDAVKDIYFIKDVELHEVSVVSVPCNQDSTFSVAKSMEAQDFEQFKNQITPESGESKDIKMTIEELKALAAEIAKSTPAAPAPVVDVTAAAEAAAAKIEATRIATAAATKAASDAVIAAKAEAKALAMESAKTLVEELKTELSAKDSAFADMVKANNDQIVALKEEIAQVVTSHKPTMSAIAKGMNGLATSEKELAETADNLMFLSTIKKMDMFDTEFGKNVKAVNASSSIEVSSDGYETTFATNLQRDIQAALVIAPLFKEINMTSGNMTFPINPDRSTATWITGAQLADGSDKARTGAEVTVALTEVTLKTFKLAAKVYLTEETQEDAIISLVPILRQHLVEAHAASIDAGFLIGTGTNQPKGLATQAAGAGGKQVSISLANSTNVLVTAAGILAARSGLGLYGIDLSELIVVISQDAYWDLIQDTEWADVQQVGQANATKLKGEVGNVYGMRVLVSNGFEAAALGKTYAVIVNTSNFVVPRQRGVTVKSDFDVELDRTVFVATQRLNLQAWIEESAGNGKGVVAINYAAA